MDLGTIQTTGRGRPHRNKNGALRKHRPVVARKLGVEQHAALIAGLPRTADLAGRKNERGTWVASNASELGWAR